MMKPCWFRHAKSSWSDSVHVAEPRRLDAEQGEDGPAQEHGPEEGAERGGVGDQVEDEEHLYGSQI